MAILFLGIFKNSSFAQSSKDEPVTDPTPPFAPNSEFRTWSIGFSGAALSQYTAFLGTSDFKTPKTEPGYGIYIKKQLVPVLGIQADFFGGSLQGKTSEFGPYSNFNTQINAAASLSLNFALFNIDWRRSNTFLQPYVTLGGGIVKYQGTVYDYSNAGTAIKSSTPIMVPMGVGLKFGISKEVNIDLGYQVNFVDADNLDGYEYRGNNDRFSYSHIGIEFTLGNRDKPRLGSHNVGPAMREEYITGINSLKNQVSSLKQQSDSAQIAAQTRDDKLASAVDKVTKDSDGDGVADQFDKCPGTIKGVKVDGSGCPLPATIVKYVYVTAEDEKVAQDVITTLEFDLMKSTIRPSSYPNLDKLALLLKTKSIKLQLDGYTDNTGPDWRNLALSTNRAMAVKKYLVKKGANPDNIEANGHGNANPVASNETLEGRRQNRRVDFTLKDGVIKE